MEYFVRHFGTDHKVLCRYGDWCSLEGKGVVHVSEIEGVLPCDGYNSSVQLPHFLAAPTPKPEQKLTNPKDAVGTKKVSFSVLPWRVLVNVALAMMEGALKYGRHNYRAAGV
ncbi:MAG: dATP/dGTP diphosphohydrolase domain-containing protein, partial [bacterium]